MQQMPSRQDRQGLWLQLSPPFCWSVSRAMPPVLIPTRLLRALANLASVSVSFAKALPMTGSSPVPSGDRHDTVQLTGGGAPRRQHTFVQRSQRPWTDSAAVKCPYSGRAAVVQDVFRQYESVSRLAEQGRPEDMKEGEGILSVTGPEHGAVSEAECGAGEVANSGQERANNG